MRLGTKEVEFPLIQGGMGVGVSLGNLAGHVAKNGGIGVISSVNAGYMEPDFEKNTKEANLRALEREIRKAKEIARGNGLVGVNIMTAVTNYEDTCRCAVRAGADVIISGAGLPLNLPEFVAGSETLCAPIVSSGRAARLLIRQYERRYNRPPDFFVLEGHMAGGHLGFSNEELKNQTCKDNFTLLREVKEAAGDIPVFVAGGVYDGKDMAAFVKAGAAGVQIGTRFIATEECDAADGFKQAIVNAKEEDIRIIESPVGMPARAIFSPMLKRLRQGEKFMALRCNNCLTACKKKDAPYCISRALIEAVKGNWEDGLFFTGSNGARVDKILTVKELFAEIKREYEGAYQMKKVLLFAGQGSQKVGMGKDFYEQYTVYRDLVDSLETEKDVKQLMHEGPLEELSRTENTQVCMAVFAAGIVKLLREEGVEFEAAAGLSLGEYGALYAAGVFTEKEYIDLLQFRGRAMMEAAKGTQTSTSAILGMDSAVIREVCEGIQEGYVVVANYNCPGQTVICGEEAAVAAAEAALREKGAKRCVRLNVSGPFHTAFMKQAGDALKEYFERMEFKKPQIPVAMNTTGSLLGEEDIKELLVKQVQSSVYLEQDLMALLDAGYTEYIEIGPGNTMAGFLRKTAKEKGMKVNIISIDSVADFRKVVEHEE